MIRVFRNEPHDGSDEIESILVTCGDILQRERKSVNALFIRAGWMIGTEQVPEILPFKLGVVLCEDSTNELLGILIVRVGQA